MSEFASADLNQSINLGFELQWVWKIGVKKKKNKKQKRGNFKERDFVGEIENDGTRSPGKEK